MVESALFITTLHWYGPATAEECWGRASVQPRTKALCSAERETLAVSKCACISDESNGLLEFCDGAVLALLKANVCVFLLYFFPVLTHFLVLVTEMLSSL